MTTTRVDSQQIIEEYQALSLDFEERTYRKVILRLVPILLFCYFAAYLDRVNVGFAKLKMMDDLRLSDTVYAFGASIFFWGYFIFEIPSNILLRRVGARFWIARIMATWAIVSMALAFVEPLAKFFSVETSTMFYTLRFLLGVCEAGFFPGVILYLNFWFPANRQSRVMAGFLIAIPFSLMTGGVVSGWIMSSTHGLLGGAGWQWMLILEGLPSLVGAVIVFCCLDDNIEKAKWLNADEKRLLSANLKSEEASKIEAIGPALRDPRVWLLTAILLTFNTGFYGIAFWLPSLIKNFGVADPLNIGLLSAIPYAVAIPAMILNAAHSRKTGERRLHAAIPAALGGAALVLSAAAAGNTVLSLAFMTIAAASILSLMPIFWTLPGQVLSGAAAAAGIGMINAFGNLAGFSGAMITDTAKTLTGNINNGTYALGASLLVCSLLILAIPRAMLAARCTGR